MEIITSFTDKISEPHKALIKNTLATGLSVCILLNAEVAIICMVANVAFSLATQHQDEIKSWLKWDNRAVQHLKDYWKTSIPFFTIRIVVLVLQKLFFIVKHPLVKQVPVAKLIQSFGNPAYAAYLIFRICVVAPIIEEIIFRGFLQEKVRNIQVMLFGPRDTEAQKTFRIGLQAFVFGVCHLHPAQGALNVVIFLFTSILGKRCGELKEKTSTLWTPMALHAHNNFSATALIIGDHFIPSLRGPVISPEAAPAA